ncbi:Rdx family-domain-containing protein [Lentinula edodes]|uniref:Rdx family-domain-containing protein n=1 Tax=Lentinula edodes TaxID=5353 RepID=UPI001E8DC672|nr:Rdx family-domain-containing protein [Lentinula edodes]KAH7879536.1 Rdx family-domain-containing protein [Lentinula edodes]
MEAPASDASCAPNEPCAAPETKDQQLEQSIANSPAYDPFNPATFVFPKPLQGTTVTIEFCDRCRWLHRATWTQTELLLTFPPPLIECISLLPRNTDETAGRFRVWLTIPASNQTDSLSNTLLWDRKVEGGFPELKVLKQRLRDKIQPGKSLGHSDKGNH